MNTCNTNIECTGVSGPQHPDPTAQQPSSSIPGCAPRTPGQPELCADSKVDQRCKPFQLTKNRDVCFIDGTVNEALNIGGADLNVYKLLGVHEQCKTTDVTGFGRPMSNGDAPGYPVSNAFSKIANQWHSVQKGSGVTASAFLGYDFGEIKLPDQSRRKYGVETSIRKHITSFSIKQSSDPTKRVTRARVERSHDGKKWYGVALVNLPDDDCLNTVVFNESVLMRYWRLRPVLFNGSDCDYWGVQALQLFHNYVVTNHDNIQDKIFLENRDRDYSTDAITIKGSYDLVDVTTELSRFGIETPSQSYYITVSFSAVVAALGRPLIIGDIIEMPSEAQYSADMRRIQKWMEVTDVAWSTEGYTPGWTPTLLRVIVQPAYASQETQDIFGDLAETDLADELGLVNNGTGRNENYQDYMDVGQEITEQSKEMVPERGTEGSSAIREWEQEEIQSAADQGVKHLGKYGHNRVGLYVEDAMPPNNAPFTEGPELPTTANHGDYHRLVYEGLSKDVPARLYRYSASKNRWVYLETDRRAEYDPVRPHLEEFLTAPGKRPHTHIVRDKPSDCDTRKD